MSNILKPNSPSRVWRQTRRKRPSYPSLQANEARVVDRPECGRNVSVPFTDADGKRQRTVLHGQFIVQREPHVSRNQVVRCHKSGDAHKPFDVTSFQDVAHKANVASRTRKLVGVFGGCTVAERNRKQELKAQEAAR